jgi:putative hydrolase of the HAD superfamily
VCPTKTNLFPDAHETLQYLQKKYHLHLISNGFREACEKKLQHSKLANYFKTIVISEIFGVNKPDRRIFEHALTNGKTNKDDAVMIGDNIDADIRGAMAVGMDAIYFNPTGAARPADVRYMVIDLKELQHIF